MNLPEQGRKPRKGGGDAVVIHDLFGKNKGGSRGAVPVVSEERATPCIIPRVFSNPGEHPYNELTWSLRKAQIVSGKGDVLFAQDDVEFPASWSDTAVNVVTSKYFHGRLDTGKREVSLRQLLDRVVDTLTQWGMADGYLATEEEAEVFNQELRWLLLNQHASFNSPVWFNVGIEEHPQCSACFINSVEDSMQAILELARTEGMLFKYGSGSGVNLSSLRSSREALSGGGVASGPVSFMRGLDAFAGAIKSGGKTRRAAKMVILNVEHPDIREFIECKAKEEKKARALVALGYDSSIDGEVYSSIMYQNANNSVRVSDRFMEAAGRDREWVTREVTTGRPSQRYSARELLRLIAECTHYCGDPGIQYDDNVNKWHTCPGSGRIQGSNPCSEYMFLDDSACNLSSLNLGRFLSDSGEFLVARFRAAVDVMILAQEITVGRAGYPSPQIQNNSVRFRPLGLGYANLGAMLMSQGLPYDSDDGRFLAAAVTAVMTGEAYRFSALLAARKGPFEEFAINRDSMLRVIRNHAAELEEIRSREVPAGLLEQARQVWSEALTLGKKNGFRNAQVTVLAPTGTIGFMMDCDTTGVEPDVALVKFKKMVGGGFMRIVNQSVPRALEKLGYSFEDRTRMLEHLETSGSLEDCQWIKAEHLPVFDCAMASPNGHRSIPYRGHLLMLAAVQPYISGAISKTVNVPAECSIDDIYDIYVDAWKLGLKAVSVYRNGSKVAQPLSTSKDGPSAGMVRGVIRRKLPDERQALTHKFNINGHEGYITVGMYEDGAPGEVFITMAKQGSTVSGLMDAFATSISIALQYGVPLATLVDKFSHLRFEPAGFTNNPKIPMAKSVMDYIFRWLSSRFTSLPPGSEEGHKAVQAEDSGEFTAELMSESFPSTNGQEDAPICSHCGDVMVRNGSCYRCSTCGETSGCS